MTLKLKRDDGRNRCQARETAAERRQGIIDGLVLIAAVCASLGLAWFAGWVLL